MSSSYLFSFVKLVDDTLGSRVDNLVDTASDVVETASEKALVSAKLEERKDAGSLTTVVSSKAESLASADSAKPVTPRPDSEEEIAVALQKQKGELERAFTERLNAERDAIRSDFELLLIEKKKQYDTKVKALEEAQSGSNNELVESLRAEIQQLKATVTETQAKASNIQLELEKEKEDVLQSLSAELQAARTAISNYESAEVELRKSLEKPNQKIENRLEEELATERERVEQLQLALDQAVLTISRFESEAKDTERTSSDIQLLLRTHVEELQASQDALSKVEKQRAIDNAAWIDEVNALRKKASELETEIESLKATNKELATPSGTPASDTHSGAQALAEELQATQKALARAEQQRATDNSAWIEELNVTKKKASELEAEVDRLKEINKELAKAGDAETEMAKLFQENSYLSDQITALKSLNSGLEVQLGNAQQELARLDENRKHSGKETGEFESLNNTIQILESQNEALAELVKSAQSMLDSRTTELSECKALMEKQASEKEGVISNLQVKIAELEQRVRSEEPETTDSTMQSLDLVLAELAEAKNALKDQDSKSKAVIDALEQELADVKAQKTRLEVSLGEPGAAAQEEVAMKLRQADASNQEYQTRISSLEATLQAAQASLEKEAELREQLTSIHQVEQTKLSQELQELREAHNLEKDNLLALNQELRESLRGVESALRYHYDELLAKERAIAETAMSELHAAEERAKEKERRAKEKIEETVKKRVENEKELLIAEARKVLDEERERVRKETQSHITTESDHLRSDLEELQERLAQVERQFDEERQALLKAHSDELANKTAALKEKFEEVAKKRVSRAREKWELEAAKERAEAIEREVAVREQRLKDKLEDVVKKRVEREKEKVINESKKTLDEERAQFEQERRKMEERITFAESERQRIQALLDMTDRRAELDQVHAAQARESVLAEVERGMRLEREELAKLREATQARVSALEAALQFERDELSKMKNRLAQSESEGSRERELAQNLAQKLREENVNLQEVSVAAERQKEKISKLEHENRALRDELIAQTELLDRLSRGESQVVQSLKERLGQKERALGAREEELDAVDRATATFKATTLATALQTLSDAKLRRYFANWRLAARGASGKASSSKKKGE